MTRQESLADLVRKMSAKDGGMVKILMWEVGTGGGRELVGVRSGRGTVQPKEQAPSWLHPS